MLKDSLRKVISGTSHFGRVINVRFAELWLMKINGFSVGLWNKKEIHLGKQFVPIGWCQLAYYLIFKIPTLSTDCITDGVFFVSNLPCDNLFTKQRIVLCRLIVEQADSSPILPTYLPAGWDYASLAEHKVRMLKVPGWIPSAATIEWRGRLLFETLESTAQQIKGSINSCYVPKMKDSSLCRLFSLQWITPACPLMSVSCGTAVCQFWCWQLFFFKKLKKKDGEKLKKRETPPPADIDNTISSQLTQGVPSGDGT